MDHKKSSPKEDWSLKGGFHLSWSDEVDHHFWRDRFHQLLQVAETPAIIFCKTGSVLEWNPAAVEHFGKKESNRSSLKVADLFPTESSILECTDIERAVTGAVTHGKEVRLIDRPVGRRLVRWECSRISGKANTPIGVMAYGKDITHEFAIQSQLEQALQELRDEKAALDQAAIVAITDPKGNITYANEKFCELSKYSREELLGKNHRVINSGYHPPSFFQELWKTIRSGEIWKGEIRNKAKDGSFYWVDTTIVPFMSPQGNPIRYVSIRTDITEKKFAQKQVDEERSRAVYSERLASLGEMAAGIAHELGTPLATIRGRMELLENQLEAGEVKSESLQRLASTVKNQADRMTRIIRGILSSARDGSRDPFELRSLKELSESVLEYSTERLRKYGIELHLEEMPVLKVECRETQVAQVFQNLIANACDAVKELDERWIRLEGIDLGNEVELAVVDSGSGISEKLADKVMEPFFTTKGVGKGTGLGLSVARNIIKSHKGELFLDKNSKNTRFVVRLPKLQETKSS